MAAILSKIAFKLTKDFFFRREYFITGTVAPKDNRKEEQLLLSLILRRQHILLLPMPWVVCSHHPTIGVELTISTWRREHNRCMILILLLQQDFSPKF